MNSKEGRDRLPLKGSQEKAILLSVSKENRETLESSMEELKELAESSGVLVVDSIIQRPQNISPFHSDGRGEVEGVIGQMYAVRSGFDYF